MMNNYKFLTKEYVNKLFRKDLVLENVLFLILFALPLKNIFVSIATIIFLFCTLFLINRKNVNVKREFFVPISLFVLMVLTLLWTKDFEKSLFGLQKALPFLVIPAAFFVRSQFSKETEGRIFKAYSFSMVFYALFYLAQALITYLKTNDTNCFFYKNLVPSDPGAIYMSVFASLALFFFIQIRNKNLLQKAGLTILVIFTFLLSSKSIITIDFIIILCYYTFFVTIPSGTKAITILSVSAFLIFSILYVKKVRERFLIEYETAFIDNTLNYDLTKEKQNIYNVSIGEAWNKKDFHHNSYFPGTALRIYQIRVFLEILAEEQVFFNGFGLEASQEFIRSKAKEHNLDAIYGEYNFHNQYLQTFADLGVVGLLLLLVMLFVNFKNALISKDFLHLAFAITMIVLFLSESFFCRQRGIVFFIVLYCLFNGASSKESEEIKSI